MGAVLPADWANTIKASLAGVEAKSTILFLAIGASGEWLTGSAARDLLPARVRNIRVMIVVMVVVDRSAVVVLFSMSQRLF